MTKSELTISVRLTLTEDLLGTAASDPEIYREFIASKAPDAKSMEEEVAAIGTDAVVEKGKSIFPKENGKPFLWDYQIKGFMKDSCSALNRVENTLSSKLKAYKKVIDGLIFIFPRKIFLSATTIGECQRPLRAMTAQGERVALAASETVPAGTTLEFQILMLNPDMTKIVEEWLNYGALRGLGQWRNSGKGRFSWVAIGESL